LGHRDGGGNRGEDYLRIDRDVRQSFCICCCAAV
jgi:hypothetical protein